MARTLALSLLIFLNLLLIAVDADISAPAPAPSVDCMPALLSLADCLTFVEQGSNLTKPEGDCCKGLKKVVKEEPLCLCEAFAGGSNFGIPLDINITKAFTLPAVCKVKTPPPSRCNTAGAPGGSPAAAPSAGSPSPTAAGEMTSATAPSPAAKSIAAHLTAPQPVTVLVLLLFSFSFTLSFGLSGR